MRGLGLRSARVATAVAVAVSLNCGSGSGPGDSSVDDASTAQDGQPLDDANSGQDAAAGGRPRRADGGTVDQGCVTHADCAPGYVCYLGYSNDQACAQGPSGSCATCQGGSCGDTFACDCLLANLCPPDALQPCVDNGKVIVCPPLPN